ncbi:MAG TPA: MASE1 domain-containing protein, partial [Campylobacterales bacterium]|nr:MASE1 domain-containing protein [Campylobacterales bacterium]
MRFTDSLGIRTIVLNVALAAVYFLSAKGVSFLSLTDEGNVFVVWPPTGIALAALLIFGARASIGIFFGALLLNASIVSIPLSIQTAIGNTLGPLLSFYLLGRFNHKQNFMLSLDGINMFFISVLFGSLVTSSNGVLALFAWGALPSEVAWGTVWYVWCVGDLIGF